MSNSVEEKNSMESPPLSPISTEPEPNSSEQLVESPVHSDPSPDENVPVSAEGLESDTGDVMEPKKKRGDPGSTRSPQGSSKLQLLAASGGVVAETAGGNFIPHVVIVKKGEDILNKLWLMGQMGPRAICILSATGAVSSAVIRTSADLGYIRYEGCFEIITLNGSFVYHTMYPHRKLGKLSIRLADADWDSFWWTCSTRRTTHSCKSYSILSKNISKELNLKRKTSAESSYIQHVVITGDPDLERVTAAVMPIQAIDRGGSCITPTSGLWGPNNREEGNVNVAYQNMNHYSSTWSCSECLAAANVISKNVSRLQQQSSLDITSLC
ncbi:hypothetical protein M0R45_016590 [Rubus argutus]|uniref:AT-hook motif nuclear-localized protein n=1 Tax=Rubus argutus TaxID=59490 RepID=A0AAW1XUY9_RUBAR